MATLPGLVAQGNLPECSDEKTNSWSFTKHLNVSCFDRVSFVDSIACYASDCGKFTPSHILNGNVPWPCVNFVVKFVVCGIAELTSTSAAV